MAKKIKGSPISAACTNEAFHHGPGSPGSAVRLACTHAVIWVAKVTRRIQAASSAFFAVILLSLAGGFYAVPFCEPFGCFAPWGGLMSGMGNNTRDAFHVMILGANLPGVLLQLPFALVLAFILLDATTRKCVELTTDDIDG